MEIIIYIGSFDPFHNGHKEAIEKVQEKTNGRIIIMPNNPRRNKPDRTPLMVRAFTLSKLYPIFLGYPQWKDKKVNILVDNLPVNDALEKISEPYSAIIGSDIIALNKKPKYQPKKWYVLERKNHPVELEKNEFYGIPIEIIPLDETKHQSLSSTMIRNSVIDSFLAMPKSLAEFYDPMRKIGLTANATTVFDQNKKKYLKLFPNQSKALEYVNRSHKIQQHFQDVSLYNWVIPKTEHILNTNTVAIEPVSEAIPLFDLIVNHQLDEAKQVIRNLNQLHQLWVKVPWRHGDLSVFNILVSKSTSHKLYLIDYEKYQLVQNPYEMINDYYLFLSSIRFYSQLLGYNLENELNELEKYGTQMYSFQYQYPNQKDKIRKDWLENDLYYEIS